MQEEEILEQQAALDRGLHQKFIAEADPSFCTALNFKIETNERPLYRRSIFVQLYSAFREGILLSVKRLLRVGSDKTIQPYSQNIVNS